MKNAPVVVGGLVVVAVAAWFGGRAWLAAGEHDEQRRAAVAHVRAALADAADGGEALKRALAALEAFPGDAELGLLQGVALVRRGRFSAAEDVLEAASAAAEGDVREEIEFYLAAARGARFVETKERADLKLSQSPLVAAAAGGGEHAAYAHALLALVLSAQGAQRDPSQALSHAEAALAAPPGRDPIDRAALTELAGRLRTELGR